MLNKQKISMIEPVGGHGGMNYYDFGLCSGLAESGYDVVLETCEQTKAPENSKFQVRHSYKGVFGKKPKWLRGSIYFISTLKVILFSILEKRRICHFHLFNVGIMQALTVALAKLALRKIVITAHDVESFVENLEVPLFSRFVYHCANKIIAHNQISAEELIRVMQVSPDKVVVIAHGNYLHMLPELPDKSTARKVLNLPVKAKVLLFFGQIKAVKGLDDLINALPKVVAEYPETVLLIAGRPWHSSFTDYEKLIQDNDVTANCITHIRYIPDEAVAYYYSAADLVVLPYRHIYQSGVVLMTMSYRKTVLVSNIPGMVEIIKDGDNGFVYDRSSTMNLSERICEIMRDPESSEKVQQRGYDYIRDKHDWITIGSAVGKLYDNLT